MSTAGPRPDTRKPAHAALEERYRLVADLLGGTEAMRRAGARYLQKAEDESPEEYAIRLNGTFLLPMFEDAVGDISSAPFERELEVNPKAEPGTLPHLLETNADGSGTRLNDFAKVLFRDATAYGAWHILVDYRGDGSQTAGQEARGEARPFFVAVHPCAVIDDRWSPDGRLIHFRYREMGEEQDPENAFATVQVERVVSWTLEQEGGSIRIERWRKQSTGAGGDAWTLEGDERIARLPGSARFKQLPIISVPFGTADGLAAQPPLIGLAWKNVEHWQSSSEQRNALRCARSGVLVFEGTSQDELDAMPITVGANRAIASPAGKVYYAELNGSSIEAGAKDLASIERAGAEMGSKPYHERAAVDTATGRRIDDKRRLTKMQAWIRATEIGLRAAFELAYAWRGIEMPRDLTIELFSDFSRGATDTDMAELIQLQGLGVITRRTLGLEAKRRGKLADNVDVEAEIEEAAREAASSVGLSADSHGDDPNSDDPSIDGEDDDGVDGDETDTGRGAA